MPGSLAARDISKSYRRRSGARPRLARRLAGRPRRDRRPERDRQVDPAARARGARAARRAAGSSAAARSASCRRSRSRAPARPCSATSARRTGVGAAADEMDALAARLGDEPELAGAYADALDRFLALGGEDFEARARAVAHRRRPRPAHGARDDDASRAARRPAPRWRRSCSRASTSSCSTSRRTTSTSPASRASSASSTGSPRASCSSRTTARSSTGRSRAWSRSRPRRGRVHEYAGTWSEYEAARERARAQHEPRLRGLPRRAAPLHGAARATAAARRTLLGGERKLARQTGGSDRRATNALRGKVQQAKNHLERLEEVEKPWSPWRLRLELPTAAPAAGWSPSSPARSSSAARSGSARSRPRAALGRPPRGRRRERLGQDRR